MIGKFIDTIIDEDKIPQTLTSYSPCFRKEVGAHGIEERGVYRIHQFEKQEMIVVCKPEDSHAWYDRLWKNTVDYFRSLDIPVRTLRVLLRRSGRPQGEVMRRGSMVTETEKVFRSRFMFKPRRCTGKTSQNKNQGKLRNISGTHSQQYLCGASENADSLP